MPNGPTFIIEWEFNGREFDGFVSAECLLKEAKGGYDRFFDEWGRPKKLVGLPSRRDDGSNEPPELGCDAKAAHPIEGFGRNRLAIGISQKSRRHRPRRTAPLLPMKNTPPLSIAFRAQFKIDLLNPPSLEDDLAKLFEFRQHLRQLSPKLAEWFLGETQRTRPFCTPPLMRAAYHCDCSRSARKIPQKEGGHHLVQLAFGTAKKALRAQPWGSYRQVKEPSLIHFETEIAEFLEYLRC
jgi:hypothetical protein